MSDTNIDAIKMKEELLESRSAMHAAMEATGIYYFDYYPEKDEAAEYNGREHFELEAHLTNYPESWFQKKITHPEDEALLREAFCKIKEGEKKAKCDVRNLMNGEYRWYHYNFTSIYDTAGNRTRVVCTAQDITDVMNVQDLNRSYEALYNRTPGWIFTCRNNEEWTMQQTNPQIYAFTGYTEKEFKEERNNSIASLIPEVYRTMIRERIADMVQAGYGSKVNYEIPAYHKDGAYTWLKVDLYWDQNEDIEGILYVSCLDITDLKKKESELLESNTMYQLTTDNANISLWKYDVQKDIMYNAENLDFADSEESVMPGFVGKVVAAGNIRQDSISDFLQMYENLRNGVESQTKDIWLRKKDKKGWVCERITYSLIMDEEGRPYRAFGIGRDVTELQEAKEKLKEERQLQEGVDNDNLLLKTRCNITRDAVELLQAKPTMQVAHPADSFSGGVLQLIERAYSDKDADLLKQNLSTGRMREALRESGYYSFEYLRKDDKMRPNWMRVGVRVLQNPDTEDVIAFIYIYDVNNEKKMTSIINRVVDADFEVLALIHLDCNEIESIQVTQDANYIGIDYNKPYDEGIREFIERYMIESEKMEALGAFSLGKIKEKLEQNNVYEVSYGVESGKRYQKKWEFTYFDDTKDTIIYSRADVTELFREQEQQKENLRDALLQAEAANKAKTNFLSRMSHEIRTPMNAIIGMNTLAAQAIDNQEQVRDCLSKVGISARFLLSLINDILDMSRIESGKVTVKEEKFSVEELVHNVNSIFYEQAEAKGIDYECVIANMVSDYYIGDSMKIQQVLVNLLGNSIKFTEKGGRIQLVVRQEREKNGLVSVAFSVNDTGCGISEEFQRKMFDPFEQSDMSITTPYKGTGLGLAISKNLVNMMNGSIHANSIVGVGTEFVVHVPLKRCHEGSYHKLKLDVPYEKLHTLIVDDDITICEHTQELLKEMGMKAEWVESGHRAVEIVQTKWEKKDYFDMILLDWKMPDMDGIETARRIRKIVGDEVTIIVMTAYDWAEIEAAAKQAGVNLLITKPLFKSTLISAFEKAFNHQEKERREVVQEEYDFLGSRILLVEDHILNVEVAKRLLTARNAQVEVAENGLRAIEMYTEAKDGHYDAILMDIRMPVMDGLTATKAIRQLRKPSAKSVPIIAMSANAFDEDIDKSKAAGMNEHLSKPIEPRILYETLNKWLVEKKVQL